MPHRLQAEPSNLSLDPAESVAALELVLEHARRYLAELDDARVRKTGSDEAALAAVQELPEDGEGTLETLRELFEISDGARVASSGPRLAIRTHTSRGAPRRPAAAHTRSAAFQTRLAASVGHAGSSQRIRKAPGAS